MGIITLEKIIERMISTAILDEKDVEKKQMGNRGSRKQSADVSELAHYSLTVMADESQHMTLNDTARDVQEAAVASIHLTNE